MDICDFFEFKDLENKLDFLMLWIGMYIVVVFVVCFFVMVVDVFYGFRSKMLWFLCKYFFFNVVFLMLLVVLLKLLMDFIIIMWGNYESFLWVSSFIFMLIAMVNFLMFLGFMDYNEMLLNLVVLGIMMIMVIGNVCIYNIYLDNFGYSEFVVMCFIFILFVKFCFSVLIVVIISSYMECKY